MNRSIRLACLGILIVLGSAMAAAAEPDADGCKDHPMLTRMPNFYIASCEESEFDSHTFYVGTTETPVEGRVYYYLYYLQPGTAEPSNLQILRNYENAIKAIGGEVLSSDYDGHSCMKVAKNGKEIWVHVSASIRTEYHLYVVEREAMKQDVTADAAVFAEGLSTTGHAAVYGIYFDTGKAEIKPESGPALTEVARLLGNQPGLKLYVVGHTDNVGNMESNLKLSRARAEAVVQALVRDHGIAPSRLAGHGVSSLCPVGSNDSEDGRKRNRRVELVKQ